MLVLTLFGCASGDAAPEIPFGSQNDADQTEGLVPKATPVDTTGGSDSPVEPDSSFQSESGAMPDIGTTPSPDLPGWITALPAEILDTRIIAVRDEESPGRRYSVLLRSNDENVDEIATAMADLGQRSGFSIENEDTLRNLPELAAQNGSAEGLLMQIAISGGLFGDTSDPVTPAGEELILRVWYSAESFGEPPSGDEQELYLIRSDMSPSSYGFDAEEVLEHGRALEPGGFVLLLAYDDLSSRAELTP